MDLSENKRKAVLDPSASACVPHGSEIFFNTPQGTVSTSVLSLFTFMSPFKQLYCSHMLTGSQEPSSVVSVNQRHHTPKSIPKGTRSCTHLSHVLSWHFCPCQHQVFAQVLTSGLFIFSLHTLACIQENILGREYSVPFGEKEGSIYKFFISGKF